MLSDCTSTPNRYGNKIVSPITTCAISELKDTDAIIYLTQKEKDSIKSLVNKTVFIPFMRTFTNYERKSILSLAINTALYDQVPTLIKSDININQQDVCGNTALMYLAISDEPENTIVSLIELLIANNAEVNLQNNDGKTALMLAIEYGTTTTLAETILRAGNANPELLDAQENTAWDILQKNDTLSSPFLSRQLAVNAKQKYVEIMENYESGGLKRVSIQGISSSDTYKNGNFLMWTAQYTKNPRSTLEEFINVTDINDTDAKNRNALFYAIDNVHRVHTSIQAITILIDAGIDIDHQDYEGNTPLLYALQKNVDKNIILQLIDLGASVDIKNNQEYNALFAAAQHYTNIKTFRKLLSQNMDSNTTTSDNTTPLMLLAQGINADNSPIFKLFIKKYNANVDKLDNDGNLAIHYAAQNTKKYDVIKLLLPILAMVSQGNNEGKTALHMAAQYNTNINIVKTLVNIGGNFSIQVKDSAGKIAAMYSAEYNPNEKITDYLLKKYKESYLQTDSNGNTPLMLSALNIYSDKVFNIVLAKEKNINRKNHNGDTVLMLAAEFSPYPAIVKSLIKKKASLNIQNSKGQTALMLAMRNKHTSEMVELLINAHAEIKLIDNNGVPAVIYAARDSIFIDHIRTIRKAGASNEYITQDGKTIHDLLLGNKYLAPYIR